jgi:polar amino acid transport system substrate-binding protein
MKIKNVIILLLLAMVISISGMAQKTLSKIIKNGEIRVGMTGNQPPFTMKAKNGELIGYEVDLATALAENMGVELKLVEMPFAELMTALSEGKVDAVMSGMTITPERNLNALFAGPHMLSGKSILTKSKVLAEISEAEEINKGQYKVVCLKGSNSEKFVTTFMPNAEMIPVEKYDMGVDMVINDQADAMVADYPICVVTLLRNPDMGLATLDTPLTIEPIGIALPPGDAQFLNLVDNYIASLQLSGAMSLLQTVWFDDGSWLFRIE